VTPEQYDEEAVAIGRALPAGPKVAVIGSGILWGHGTNEICVGMGVHLATIEDLVLITGGISGVGEAVGRSFFAARNRYHLAANTYQILPRGSAEWDYGVTVAGGETMEDRREILGRLAALYISIEGGPGTAHEAQVAQTRGATIIPVARTGGFSKEAYMKIACPRPGMVSQWGLLDDRDADVESVCLAVLQIIEILIQKT
jgi:predicted Rossmann-fold nucleotide-binding protein